jgi:AraC-like DNA-binding protein
MANAAFRKWREAVSEQVMPLAITRVGEGDFSGCIETAEVGSLTFTRISTSATIQTTLTPAAIRRSQKEDTVTLALPISGSLTVSQADRHAVTKPGDIVVLDRRSSAMVTGEGSRGLYIDVPVHRLEQAIGPTQLYARVRIGSEQATTRLAINFFRHLLQVSDMVDTGTAQQISSAGIDLLIASIAEHVQRDVPRPLQSTLTLQRAKAYVEDHLHDSRLGPPELAAALGLSLRRLQELFHERGRHISDYIWDRRLTRAAKRLSDVRSINIQIGILAFECGFTSQAHFSRRFKERHGMTPRTFREEALRRSLQIGSGL